MALTVPVSEIVEKTNNPLLAKHESWERVLLGDIATVQNGFAFKSSQFTTDEGFPIIRIRDVGKDKSETNYVGEYDPAFVVRAGDLLVGMDGDFNCARWRGPDSLLNQRVCRIILTSHDYHPKFLDYALPGYLKAINDVTSSVTVKHLSSKSIKEIPLPLAPMEVQKRIVAEIEKQFSRLDEAVANLKRVKANLKRYKAAVLKAAVEGKLTEEWRKQHPDVEPADKLLERIECARNKWLDDEISEGKGEARRLKSKLGKHSFEVPENVGLPVSWAWASFLTASQVVVDCHNKTAPYQDSGIYLIRTTNIRNGKLILDGVKYVSNETYDYWSRRCIPEPGDILFTREAPMGEATIIPEDTKICMGQRTMLIRLFDQYIDNKYLLYLILSPPFQGRMGQGAVGTGVKHLRVGDVESLAVPVPPFEEQKELVAQLDAKISVIEEAEAEVDANLRRGDRLRQSILSKAFSGRLVNTSSNVLKVVQEQS